MRHRLEGDPRLSVSVMGRYEEGADDRADAQVRAALHRALPGASARIEEVLHASVPMTVVSPAGAADGGLALTPLAVAEPQRFAELVQGAWAQDASQVVLSEQAARRMGVSVGATVPLAKGVGGLSVTVSGVYREAADAQAFWQAWTASSALKSSAGLALVSRDLLRTSPVLRDETDAQWTAVPDADRLRIDALATLRSRVERLTQGDASRSVFRGSEPALAALRANSDIPAALDGLRSPMMVARSGMLVPVTMLGVLSAVTMVLTARQLADFRRAELLLQLARGAGRARLLRAAAAEWALCTVPAALLGVWVAGPLLRVLERLGLPVEGAAAEAVGPAAWAVAGTALVLHGCAALLPVAWTADGGERETPSRSARRVVAQRAGADLVLAAVAVLAYLQLRQYQGLLSPASTSVGFDPVLVAAPVVMTVAAALLLLRLLPPLGRALESLARRGRGLVAPLSGWQVSRGRAGQGAPVLLMALALAVGALTTTVIAGEAPNDRDRAAFEVGADLRVTGGELPPEQRYGALAGLPGVAAVTPLVSASGEVRGAPVTVFGLDTAAVRGVVTPERMAPGASVHAVPALRSDLERGSLAGQLDRLGADVPVHGMAVAGRPASVEVQVSVASQDPVERTGPVWLVAEVEDASGLVTTVRQRLTPDGVSRAVALPLAPGVHYPVQVTRLSLRSTPVKGFARALLTFTVSGVRGASLPEGTRWKDVTRGTGGAATGLGCPGRSDEGPAERVLRAGVCGSSRPDGGLLTASVRGADPSIGVPPEQAESFALSTGDDTVSFALLPVSGAQHRDVVPALVNAAFLRATGCQVGRETRLVSGEADRFGLLVVGVLEDLPGGQGRDVPQALVDLRALSSARSALGLEPAADEAWLLAAASGGGVVAAERAIAADPRLGRADSARARAAALAEDPFRAGRRSALVLSLALSPVFAVAGFTVHAVGSARSRRREFAVLRALGVRRRQLAGVLRLEQSVVVGFAVLLGGVLGVVLAAVVLPLIVVDNGGRAVFPSLELTVGWGWTAGVVLATGLGVGSVVLVLSRMLARVDLARELRAGENG
ncbi:FtsX-like permease family protein [Kitasatospora sp. NA04385]|uniref:FtsX-like permease family protein n=1 Tax=Kitasatospora sp. NA04385 TaxID=2742135 RepID=UPI001590E872|nr:FtsX-like permease family protein [Kitasatospora sp. NA04385]QKW21936.1 FtsX-like permease family protein [Kitasatospora sp. NA04385]